MFNKVFDKIFNPFLIHRQWRKMQEGGARATKRQHIPEQQRIKEAQNEWLASLSEEDRAHLAAVSHGLQHILEIYCEIPLDKDLAVAIMSSLIMTWEKRNERELFQAAERLHEKEKL